MASEEYTIECEPSPSLKLIKKNEREKSRFSCFKKTKCQLTNVEKNGELELNPNPQLAEGEILPPSMHQMLTYELISVPIEDVDSYYKNQQTFVAIGSNKRIHRFSRNGLDILSPFNVLRRTAIFILTDVLFKFIMAATILTNCLFLLVESSLPPYTELIFLLMYVFELSVKILARGIILGQFTYLRIPWNWLDLLIIFGSSFIKSLTILKMIPLFPGLLDGFRKLLKTGLSFLKMSVLIFIVITVVAINAYQLFSNSLKSRCVMEKSSLQQDTIDLCKDESSWHLDLNYKGVLEDTICGNSSGSKTCPEGYRCVPNCGESPDSGWTSFDTFPLTVFTVVGLLFQDNTHEMYRHMSNAMGPWCTIFFGVAVFVGTFAIGVTAYGIAGKWILQSTIETDIRCVEDEVTASVAPEETDSTSNQSPTTSQNLPIPRLTAKQRILHVTEIFTVAVIILDISATILYTYGISEQYEIEENIFDNFYGIVTKICVSVYTLEALFKIICKGPRAYFKNGWDNFNLLIITFGWLNMAVEDVNVLENWYFFSKGTFGVILTFLFINVLQFRTLKVVPRSATLKTIATIIWNFFHSFGNLVLLLLMFLFVFSYAGKSSFGAAYYDREYLFPEQTMPRWNFMDLQHSLMIIIRLLAGEWIVTFRNCYIVSGNYCLLYYIPCVLIGQLLIVICSVAVVVTTVRTLTSLTNTQTELETAVDWLTSHHICQSIKRKINCICQPMKRKFDLKCNYLKCPSSQNLPQINWKWFPTKEVVDKISSTVILLTWIPLIFEYSSPTSFQVVFYTDVIFVIFFASEIKIIYAMGHHQFMTCLLDLLFVLVTVATLCLDKDNPERLILVHMKSCRLIMTVTRIENLKAVGFGLAKQLKAVRYFILSGLFIWLLFAMKAIWDFNLGFYKCINPKDNSVPDYKIIENSETCRANNFSWVSLNNFDNFTNSFLRLAQVASLNGYASIAEDASDMQGADIQPLREVGYHMHLFFILFFIFGVFFLFNIIFGVIFKNIMDKQPVGLFMTKKQLVQYGNQRGTIDLLTPFEYPRQNNRLGIFHDIVSNWKFDIVIMLIIFIDVLSMTLYKIKEKEYYSLVPRYTILAVYISEVILKILGWGKHYWLNGWNILDFSVVIYGIFDLAFGNLLGCELYSALARVARLLRLLQFEPLLRRCNLLNRFLTALILIKSTLFNLLIFFSLFVLILGLIWSRPNYQNFDPKSPFKAQNFLSFPNVLLDLFQVLTFSGWYIITEGIQQEGQDCQESALGNCPKQSSYPISYIFICLAISFWMTMNMYLVFILEFLKQLGLELVDTKYLDEDNVQLERDECEFTNNKHEDSLDSNQEMQDLEQRRDSPNPNVSRQNIQSPSPTVSELEITTTAN